MSGPVEAVIFDLDGTLLHSNLDFDLIRREIGIDEGPILEAIRKMPARQLRRAMQILDDHESAAAAQAQLDTRARNVLDALADRRIKTALLTRNSRASVDTALTRHNLRFDLTCSREDHPIKPSPEPVLAICTALKVSATRTMLVGDYLFDLQSANDAGARSVLLRNEKNAEFISHAWRVIECLDEVLDLLDS